MDERYDQSDCTLLSLIVILTNVALACMSLIIVFSLRMANCLINLYTDWASKANGNRDNNYYRYLYVYVHVYN